MMRTMKSRLALVLCAGIAFAGPRLSPGGRFFQDYSGEPFFWLGDTGWLLFQKLDRREAEEYLEKRRVQGFNVIQAMVLHASDDKNAYGSAALIDGNPAQPNLAGANNYWQHIDWIVDKAAAKGLHIGMVAAWGSVARSHRLNEDNVAAYARWLVERYGKRPNIVWITGGDTEGNREISVWRRMGETFRALDPNHLITFHPFGRTQSSTWFHNEAWLDFNMFQSGHRRYDQDTAPGAKGEDNWRYVLEDYARQPPKPTIDGEPSYEGIPQGLHDPAEPFWADRDVRRYAYWSVFAGAAGHTYGHNAVMQMYKEGKGAYGNRKLWTVAMDDPGAGQMKYLKGLMLSRPYFERVPDQSLIAGRNGTRYDYVIATRGQGYAFAYTYTGRPFKARLGVVSGTKVRAWWFDPRTGAAREIGTFDNAGERDFTPPGTPVPGNDWVLVLDDAASKWAQPGR